MSSNQHIIRQGETDNTLTHFTDTDPNRFVESQHEESASIRNPPPLRPSTGNSNNRRPSNVGGIAGPRFLEGTEGNPLRGMNNNNNNRRGSSDDFNNNRPSDAAEFPNVAQAVEQRANPSMAHKRKGKVTMAPDSSSSAFSRSTTNLVGGDGLEETNGLGSGSAVIPSGGMGLMVPSMLTMSGQQQPSGDFTSPLATSKSVNLEARRKAGEERKKTHEKAGTRSKQEPNMFASMMLGGGFNPNAASSGEFSPAHHNDQHNSHLNDDARSMARSHRSVARSNAGGGIGDVISALPQEEGPAMLIPATMEAPDQIFMPNMKREPYVPVRLARDKIKQALSEIASHNSKHYAAIETMEKQYEILKAQMEHQVATYAKKLTFHYNQRVADLNNQLKERLSSGAKGQAFAQLMNDVDKWKSRATDAEQELEVARKELDKMKEERDNALYQLAAAGSVMGNNNNNNSTNNLPNASTATAMGLPRYAGGIDDSDDV